jgi:putative transposase
LAVHDVAQAWKNFFNPKMPDHAKPKFKSRKRSRQVFKTDRATIIDGKLRLDKPYAYQGAWYGIRLAETPRWKGTIHLATIVEEADGYYVSLSIEVERPKALPVSERVCGVDANIGKYVYNDGDTMAFLPVLTVKLISLYDRISLYQRQLARKRQENPGHFFSKHYRATKTKLKRPIRKCHGSKMTSCRS